MPKIFSAQAVVFFLASLVTLIFIYLKVEIVWLQRIIAVLLFTLLILLNRFLNPDKAQKLSQTLSRIFLFLTTVFVQLIILSTGGLKSPFLALIHIFTLGISFLINLPSALIFLALTLSTIIANFYFDKNIQSLFTDDPGSVLLYLVSFVVIVLLSIVVTRYYYLKDAVAKLLSREVRTKELQQQMMLQGLNELVIVTDRDLNIISSNEAAEKLLSSTGAVILKRSIFDILFLKDVNENMMTKDSLYIDQIIEKRQGRDLPDLYLFTKNTAMPRKVTLIVKPIVNLEGVVDQMSFVISDSSRTFTDSKVSHINLETARTKQKAALEEFKAKLIGSVDLALRIEILDRTQQDLLSATEIEDHIIGDRAQLTDIAELCKRAVIAEDSFAQALKVKLVFSLLNFGNTDTAKIVPTGLNIAPINLTAPFFTAPVDVKWFNTLIQKLLDLAVLLTSGIEGAEVKLTIDREGDKILVVGVSSNYPGLSEEESKLLLIQYYGLLGNITNLRFGSGLEGFIAKQIAISLNIPLTIISEKGKSGVSFQLKVNKSPTS